MVVDQVAYLNNHLIQMVEAIHKLRYLIITIELINIVVITEEAIYQLHQMGSSFVVHFIDCFEIILHQKGFVKVDGMFKLFHIKTCLVP